MGLSHCLGEKSLWITYISSVACTTVDKCIGTDESLFLGWRGRKGPVDHI